MSAALDTAAPLPGHRFRSTVSRTPNGRFLLRLVGPNGTGGACEYDTQAAALSGISALYAFITTPALPVRGMAADGPNGHTPRIAP